MPPLAAHHPLHTLSSLLVQPSVEDKEWYMEECFNCCSTKWIMFMWLNKSGSSVIEGLSKARCYMVARMVQGLRKRKWLQGALDIDREAPLVPMQRATLKQRG